MASRKPISALIQRAIVGANSTHHNEQLRYIRIIVSTDNVWGKIDPIYNFDRRSCHFFSTLSPPLSEKRESLSINETRGLVEHMKLDDFKRHLFGSKRTADSISLDDAIKLCKQIGPAISDAEAEEVIKRLDEAGVILIFRKRVFLDPQRVAELLSKAIPLPLAHDDDPRIKELARLEKEKAEIDKIAHQQVRNMLWGSLGAFAAQSALFFRLTFWDLSWDVMEPITFFVTSSSLWVGFFFFVITNRDPSYRDFMCTLLSSKQKKLMREKNFDLERLKELQMQCCLPRYDKQQIDVTRSFRT